MRQVEFFRANGFEGPGVELCLGKRVSEKKKRGELARKTSLGVNGSAKVSWRSFTIFFHPKRVPPTVSK